MSQGIILSIIGLGAVFAVLVIIAVVVALLGRADRRWQEAEARPPANTPRDDAKIDDLTLVLISAAVATTVVGRYRIRSVRRLPRALGTGQWTAVSRASLHGSHAIRPRSPSGRKQS